MKSVFVYCEIENENVAEISQELLSAGKRLAQKLGAPLEAMVFGNNLNGIESQISPYGVDKLFIADDSKLDPYRTLPHAALAYKILKEQDPQIVLFGATSVGRDLAPRLASKLNCGLTADTTILDIGDHFVKKEKKEYTDLLYAIRPAFGGSIMANIINWDMHPQMATVREGVMKKEIIDENYKTEIIEINANEVLSDEDFVVEVIERHIEESGVNLKESPIIVAGGYGVGSKENFDLLRNLANILGGEVGGSRAAVDAGFIDHNRQIGQTGTTVRPKLYIAAGISGAIQHTAGMQDASMIISINNDPDAPINAIADYVITGDLGVVLPKMIKYYKENAK
ncbi:MAG: electron transfer flavoprotein subunit alpha/FixB family protein [Lutibacter sp.]|uniref:electron transfer flavoprotein subunit alpha/FixB family protein n=1 Tax=Lutibacter sp. TaxID=1925666 RepID=UPI00178E6944|nr:electron transfer flavoprotein subunit alpha/FixB family protein [Lutibacter sp.]MBT8317114.1 electron transfer flavoprotein subunit alpha/FixB family protein [Lutibacter sp.]NNJ57974.1 electron transfer flavoprotein subunit alpha/FixB family protein [Lutibacter sp.]